MTTSDALYLTGRATRAQREREAARRLGISWLAMVGWPEGPLLVVSSSDARFSKHVREECRRVERMAQRSRLAGLSEEERSAPARLSSNNTFCVLGERETAALRRAVVEALRPWRLANDLFAVDSSFAAAQVEAAAALLGSPLLSDSGRAEAVRREMERV